MFKREQKYFCERGVFVVGSQILHLGQEAYFAIVGKTHAQGSLKS